MDDSAFLTPLSEATVFATIMRTGTRYGYQQRQGRTSPEMNDTCVGWRVEGTAKGSALINSGQPDGVKPPLKGKPGWRPWDIFHQSKECGSDCVGLAWE